MKTASLRMTEKRSLRRASEDGSLIITKNSASLRMTEKKVAQEGK
jgi:hypothetical protein